jgi:hypothetical protein
VSGQARGAVTASGGNAVGKDLSSSQESSGAERGETGVEYAAFFQRLVDGQDARKSSIEQRGISVITTSGALVTLLFGVVALVTKNASYHLPNEAYIPLGLALLAFVGAAALALLTNIPSKGYVNVDGDQVEKLLDYIGESPPNARLRLAATNLKVFRSAQGANEEKANVLKSAMICEVIAVVALSVAVFVVLIGAA